MMITNSILVIIKQKKNLEIKVGSVVIVMYKCRLVICKLIQCDDVIK